VQQPATLTYLDAKTYTIKRTISITNGDADIDVIRIWLPAITDSESQKVVTASASTAPTSSQIDASTGAGEDFWEFRGMPAQGTSVSFTQQYPVKVFQVMLTSEDMDTVPYDRSNPEYLTYTRSEKFIEADNQAIISTARKLAGSETNPCRIARIYYQYVNNYMNYQLVYGLRGAAFALENGYGNCGDYTALFVALRRASGIPARPVVGRLVLPPDGGVHVCGRSFTCRVLVGCLSTPVMALRTMLPMHSESLTTGDSHSTPRITFRLYLNLNGYRCPTIFFRHIPGNIGAIPGTKRPLR
jgi:transglutaminase-like putative cysteine protease